MISKEQLEKYYFDEQLTWKQIATKHNVSETSVKNWIKKYQLKPRKKITRRKIFVNNEILKHLYLVEKLTLKQIAVKYNVTTTTISRLLKSEGIIGRKQDQYAKIIDESILRNLYLVEKFSYKQISEQLNCSVGVIYRNIKLYNIPARPSYNSLGKPLSLEAIKKLSKALKGRVFSKKHRLNISLAMRGHKHPNYGKPAKHHGKRCWYTCPNGNTISMRSNWEVAYAEWLNTQKIYWEYEPKTFNLNDGSAYTPDFYLPKTNEFIEVKGWFTEKHKNVISKFLLDYPKCKLIIADKNYLQNLGINLKQKFVSTRPRKICEFCGKEFPRMNKQQRLCSVICRNRRVCEIRKNKHSKGN